MSQQNFSGTWHCRYWYPSNHHDGEEISEYYGKLHQADDQLVFESLPNKTESYMLLHLTVDGVLATGTWQENTSPHGESKGVIYSGAVQLIIADDKKHVEGKWVGVGHDYGLHKPRIYDGRWELTQVDEVPAEHKQ